jgi:hypothetical protein
VYGLGSINQFKFCGGAQDGTRFTDFHDSPTHAKKRCGKVTGGWGNGMEARKEDSESGAAWEPRIPVPCLLCSRPQNGAGV